MTSSTLSKIRIKDIANIAGVSAGTVDRVIHNRGEVSDKTRDRVIEIIRKLNYQPDILASNLAGKRNYRIAVLIPKAKQGSTFWKYPLEGIDEGLKEINHFGISVDKYYFDYSDRDSFVKKSAEVVAKMPGGLILAPVFSEEASDLVRSCNDMDIPVVLINSGVCVGNCVAFIGQDSFQSGMVAGRLMHYGLSDNTDIIIVNFIREQGNQAHILNREKGFRSYYSRYVQPGGPGLRRVSISDIADLEGDKLLNEMFPVSGSSVKGVFVTNSRVYHIAGFLERNRIEGVKLIGYDLLEENKHYLREGVIDFLISQKPREQGFKSLMTLYHHLILKKDVESDQFLPIDIITKENLEHYKFK